MSDERTDAEFLAAFENGTLPRADWTHAAHVRMAYLYLCAAQGVYEEACDRICSGIRAYNASQGNHTGYHDTITVAFVRLIHDRLRRESPSTFDSFRAAHPDLFNQRVLLRHYSRPLLFSDDARARFLEPDGIPLPVPGES